MLPLIRVPVPAAFPSLRGLLLAALIFFLLPAPGVAQYTLQDATLDGGGGRVEAGELVLTSSLATSPVGTVRSASYVLYSAGPAPALTIAIRHVPEALAVQGEPQDVTARVESYKTTIASVTLFYRRGNSGSFTATPMQRVNAEYVATIPGSEIGSTGLLYYFVAEDQDGRRVQDLGDESSFYSVRVQLAGDGPQRPDPLPGGDTESAYRLISVPVEVEDPRPEAVLGDDIPTLAGTGVYDRSVARLFEPVGTGVFEFPRLQHAFEVGKAFWLIVRDGAPAFDAGPGTVQTLNEPFEVALNQGWNFIGTPFPVPVPIENVTWTNSEEVRLYAYGADGYSTLDNPVTEMVPFEGYALFATTSTTLTIRPPLSVEEATTSATRTRVAAKSASGLAWRLRLRGTHELGRDADNIAAVHTEATDAWDAQDWPEPPSIGGGLRIAFDAPSGAPNNTTLSADVRRPSPTGITWPLTVYANAPGPVRLSVDGLAQVPSSFDVWLVDLSTQSSWNLRTTPTARLHVLGENEKRALRLVVGTDDYVKKTFQGLSVLPDVYALGAPYPNPSTGPVAFRIELPKDERVTIAVYNILGQRLAMLKNNESMTAGIHTVVWESPRLASGMYFVRMQAANYRKTQKLIRIQ